MTWICKNVYIDQLDHTAGKYNNRRYSAITMKCFDVNSSTHIDFNKENNK